MKKTIITILFAFLLGCILSCLTIYELKDKLNFIVDDETVTAFQVGVYKSLENAQKTASNHPNAITVKDGDYYRVYIGIAKGQEWEKTLESYYQNKNVNVYPKEIKVTSSFMKEISKYESFMTQTDEGVLEEVNSKILKQLEGEIL